MKYYNAEEFELQKYDNILRVIIYLFIYFLFNNNIEIHLIKYGECQEFMEIKSRLKIYFWIWRFCKLNPCCYEIKIKFIISWRCNLTLIINEPSLLN